MVRLLAQVINIIKLYSKADIVRVFSLNAMSTLIRMISGLISVKIIALLIGPAGIALLGQLQNFVSLSLGYSNGGIQNGITKYVAEYRNDDNKIKDYLSGALKISLFFTIVTSIVMIGLHNQLSAWIMRSKEYGYLFVIFGITIFMYTLNLLLISVLNGYKEYRKYVIVNIAGSIFGLLFIVAFVIWGGLPGALISAVTYQSMVFVVTVLICRKCLWFKWSIFCGKLKKDITRQYLSYSAMTLVSLALLPISQMLLRGYVISEISATEAGWWESMNRISSTYLMVVTTSFSVYYLPRLSELHDKTDIHHEIMKCYKVLIPFLFILLMSIFVFRRIVITMLFSSDFYPMESLFLWQEIGDFFKVISWVLAYIMLAKAMTKRFIITEIVFVTLNTFLSFVLLHFSGIVGLTQGYMISYILYTSAMLFLFKDVVFIKAKNENINNWRI